MRFRIANGSTQDVQCDPDIVTYAKALRNGYPMRLLAVKGDHVDPRAWCVAGRNFCDDNLAWLARCHVSLLKSKLIIKSIEKRGQRLMDGLKENV